MSATINLITVCLQYRTLTDPPIPFLVRSSPWTERLDRLKILPRWPALYFSVILLVLTLFVPSKPNRMMARRGGSSSIDANHPPSPQPLPIVVLSSVLCGNPWQSRAPPFQ